MTHLEDWLVELGDALDGAADMDVPCGPCTACCTSAQFVLVEPDDHAARAAIPAELLVPAPGLPADHLLLGHDGRGHCPMLGDAGCAIYGSRPRACRTYDCRVFAVADVEPDQPLIASAAAERPVEGGAELLASLRDAVDGDVARPLERALRAVAPVAVQLARSRARRPLHP